MSENTHSDGSSFIMKLCAFIVDKRNLFFLIFIIGIIFSAFSVGWVSVENDLAAYLPDGYETKNGMDIMDEEFVTFGTAKVAVANITYREAENVLDIIENTEGVSSVDFDDTEKHYNDVAALYEITFDWDENDDRSLEAFERVKENLGDYDIFTSTTMGDTDSEQLASEMRVIILLVAIVVVSVLLFTSQTYAEIAVLLMTFIASAIVNMGTSFLLGTISFISNSVTIVLQLALSVDYAIILCNRYKEEHQNLPTREAVIVALSKAIPEISASCLTTIGGLVALMFMKFKIGPDMAINLIKAVFFSIITTFLLMPGLLVLFGKAIDKTHHKNFVPEIPFAGRFAYATRLIIPPIFLVLLVGAFFFSNNCPYVYGDDTIATPIINEQQKATNFINDTFGTKNMLAVVVPSGDYTTEKKMLDEIEKNEVVTSTVGLSNSEAMDGYMLTDSLTPRQFSELTDVDYEVAGLLYAAYAADNDDYGKIVGGLSTYGVPLMDMFLFLHQEIDEGYVTLDDDLMSDLDEAYDKITNARKQLLSDNYTRMLVYVDLPSSGDEVFGYIDSLRELVASYYPDGETYVVGDSTSKYDFYTTFQTDNVIVSIVSILIVLVVLLFTFKSVGMPLLLIIVIQGAIWINFAIPTITHSDLFFMSYLIVSSIQMGANIDYAIVISNRYMELKNEMSHKDAIIATLNQSFPTIITSGSMMVIAGVLIGQLTSNAAIVGIGQSLGRGTIISLIIVMFVLPQLLLIGGGLIDRTSFSVNTRIHRHGASGKVRVDGLVRGQINGNVVGTVHAIIDGSVDLNVISGTVNGGNPELPPPDDPDGYDGEESTSAQETEVTSHE